MVIALWVEGKVISQKTISFTQQSSAPGNLKSGILDIFIT